MLMANPNFAQIKQLIRTNPAALEPILQQISQASPELYTLISQYPEAFQKVILEDGVPATGGLQPPRPPPGSIQVTPE